MFLFIHKLGGVRSLWLPQIRGILGLDESYSDKQILDLFTLALPGHPDDDEELSFEKTRELVSLFAESKFAKQEELSRKMVLVNRPEIIRAMKSPKLVIVGHELGGAIALDYTLANLHRINRLVLVGCGNHFNRWGLKLLRYYYRRLANSSLNDLRRRYLRVKNLWLKNFLYIFSENISRKSLESGLKMLQVFDFWESFQKLDLDQQFSMTKIPILAIRGQFDWLCPSNSLTRLQRILDPSKEIWQQRRKAAIHLGQQEANVTIKTYHLSGPNPMDKDPISFALDIRQFLKV